MKTLRNEKGIALAMVLILAGISLAIMAGMIYLITVGTQVGGVQKHYRTALEAGTGGSELIWNVIAGGGAGTPDPNLVTSFNLAYKTPLTCQNNPGVVIPQFGTCGDLGSFTGIEAKVKLPTICWRGCDSSMPIDITNSDTYDLRFNLGTGTVYDVYGKIVDTQMGNTVFSGSGGALIQGGVVWSNLEVAVVPMPYRYTIEIDAENLGQTVGKRERAKISILYQH